MFTQEEISNLVKLIISDVKKETGIDDDLVILSAMLNTPFMKS